MGVQSSLSAAHQRMRHRITSKNRPSSGRVLSCSLRSCRNGHPQLTHHTTIPPGLIQSWHVHRIMYPSEGERRECFWHLGECRINRARCGSARRRFPSHQSFFEVSAFTVEDMRAAIIPRETSIRIAVLVARSGDRNCHRAHAAQLA